MQFPQEKHSSIAADFREGMNTESNTSILLTLFKSTNLKCTVGSLFPLVLWNTNITKCSIKTCHIKMHACTDEINTDDEFSMWGIQGRYSYFSYVWSAVVIWATVAGSKGEQGLLVRMSGGGGAEGTGLLAVGVEGGQSVDCLCSYFCCWWEGSEMKWERVGLTPIVLCHCWGKKSGVARCHLCLFHWWELKEEGGRVARPLPVTCSWVMYEEGWLWWGLLLSFLAEVWGEGECALLLPLSFLLPL